MIERITADDLGIKVIDAVKVNRGWHFKHGGLMYAQQYNNLKTIRYTTVNMFMEDTVAIWMIKGLKHRS